ncbi:hypothetical protein BASA81_005338 [Batrachochytrium salamandrivorans]|nr:hypothetical protein BASA81_005338 [Batrachochytrium salamandrivorans]
MLGRGAAALGAMLLLALVSTLLPPPLLLPDFVLIPVPSSFHLPRPRNTSSPTSSSPTVSPTTSPPTLLPTSSPTNQVIFPLRFRGPTPTHLIRWCNEEDDLLYAPLVQRLKLAAKTKHKVLIFMFGDSTLHEPFSYLSKCIFRQGIPWPKGNDTTRHYSVKNSKIQVLFFPNYWESKVYSLQGNRALGKLDLFKRHAAPGYVPTLAWVNFGLLHTLHRYPARMDAGDYWGWRRMEEWIVEDLHVLAHQYNFSAILVSTPHSICGKQFKGDRLAWLNAFDPDNGECIDYFTKQAETISVVQRQEVAEFCREGAGTPVLAKQLQQRFDLVLTQTMSELAVVGLGIKMLGIQNNTFATESMCRNAITNDGVHFESLVPQQVDSMLSFVWDEVVRK